MESNIRRIKENKVATRKFAHEESSKETTSAEIDLALQEYLKRGGKIKRVVTDWVDDGQYY